MRIRLDRTNRNALLQAIVIVAIINIPFITVASNMGCSAFADSFRNAPEYRSFSDEGDLIVMSSIEISDFESVESDDLCYLSKTGDYKLVSSAFNNQASSTGPIIGRAVCKMEDTLLNNIAIFVWDFSRDTLNIFNRG